MKVLHKICAAVLSIAIALPLLSVAGSLPVSAASEITHDDFVKLSDAFNACSSKKLSDMGTNYAHLFDPDSSAFRGLFSYTSESSSDPHSRTATSKAELLEQYAQEIAVGLSVNVHAYSVNSAINGKINETTTGISGTIQEERYEYLQATIKRKCATVDWENADVSECLSAGAKKDLGGVTSIDSAKKFLEKYGTHIFGSYHFGGSIVITRYTASVKELKEVFQENNASLNTMFSIATKNAVDGEVGYSFSSASAQKTGETVDNMDMLAEGGSSPAALSIDNLFTYNAQIFDSGYVYKGWTDSLNQDIDLKIVQAEYAFPIWEVLNRSGLLTSDQLRYFEKAFKILDLSAYSSGCEESGIENEILQKISYTDINSDKSSQTEVLPEFNRVSLPKNVEVSFQLGEIIEEEGISEEDLTYEIAGDSSFAEIKDGKLLIHEDGDGSFEVQLLLYGFPIYSLTVECGDVELSGFGTAAQPYIIGSKQDWVTFISTSKYFDEGIHIALNADIDLGGERRDVGGASKELPFKGYFDGRGHTLSNFTVIPQQSASIGSSNLWENIGIFGENRGTIENLMMSNVVVLSSNLIKTEKEGKEVNAGILVGLNDGTIKNVKIKDSAIRCSAQLGKECAFNVGAVCGKNLGDVSFAAVDGCHIYGLLYRGEGSVNVGGLIGNNSAKTDEAGNISVMSTVENCYVRSSSVNSAEVNAKNAEHRLGGFFGIVNAGVVRLCMAYGNTFNQRTKWGHVAGASNNDINRASFENCYFESDFDEAIGAKTWKGCERKSSLKLSEITNNEVEKHWTADDKGYPILKGQGGNN